MAWSGAAIRGAAPRAASRGPRVEFPVPTVDENPDFDILYWTGCAVSYDPRAQLTARALVKVLSKAGVNFAVLGEAETWTGDAARRAGNEALYQELAMANVETLNETKPPRIVVTCPHCYHNIGKEYHQFGGDYQIVHHTELIDELIDSGKLPLSAKNATKGPNVPPCSVLLGRHNDSASSLAASSAFGVTQTEMPRTRRIVWLCAGGAQSGRKRAGPNAVKGALRGSQEHRRGDRRGLAVSLRAGCARAPDESKAGRRQGHRRTRPERLK